MIRESKIGWGRGETTHNNEGRLGDSGNDHVTKVSVVSLDVTLSGGELETFLEEAPERDDKVSSGTRLVGRSRVVGDVEADDSHSSTGTGDANHVGEDSL